MANVEQTIVDAADKLVKAVEVYGPKATSLVLETGRMAAMQDLARGFAFLVVAGICFSLAVVCFKKAAKAPAHDDFAVIHFIGMIVSSFALLFSVIGALINLVDVFAWIGLQHPEIYLAAKLLKL